AEPVHLGAGCIEPAGESGKQRLGFANAPAFDRQPGGNGRERPAFLRAEQAAAVEFPGLQFRHRARKPRSSRSTSRGLSSGRKCPQSSSRPRTFTATSRQFARQSNIVPTGECLAQSARTGIASFFFTLFLSCNKSMVAAAR